MPKGYIEPNYIPAEEADSRAQQEELANEGVHRVKSQQRSYHLRRWSVFVLGVLVLLLWFPFRWNGYPGCGLILVPVGTGMVLIFFLESTLVKLVRGE